MTTITEQLAETLRAVTEALDNTLLHHGNRLSVRDHHSRSMDVANAREVLTTYDSLSKRRPRYTAETYSCAMLDGTTEQGWCVKDGDDTVCDVRTEEEARTVANLLNVPACDAEPKAFTVFIRDLDGTGTTFITLAHADDAETATRAAIAECLDAWELPDTPTSRDSLHVLGVAPGDINFIEWNDLES